MTASLEDPLPPVNFTGLLDIFSFINAAAAAGLHVILRLGPYVCAEVEYGGFPVRLRDVPDIRFRTMNKPYLEYLESWIRLLANTLRDRRLMASQGGPVILFQLENEYSMISHKYGKEGERYLQWVADLQHSLDLGVPAIMCYGAAEGVVETINAFYAHDLITSHRELHPKQPPVWTECWTGWYDVWGARHHTRPVCDLLYSVARFFAAGGAGINFYMWMGGTNIGCRTMYLQTTSYDYDAPIDEFYRHTAKSKLLSRLNLVLSQVFEPCFHTERDTDPTPVNGVYNWGKVAFVCNDDATKPLCDITLPGGKQYNKVVAPRSVHIVDCQSGACLFDTADTKDLGPRRTYRAVPTNEPSCTVVSEPVITCAEASDLGAASGDARTTVISDSPAELIGLTRGSSDYATYVARYEINEGPWQAQFEAADFAQLFVNGKYIGASATPLWEDRWSNRWNQYSNGGPGCKVTVKAPACNAKLIEICVLVASLGLVKSDWQLGERNMLEERKGLLSDVTVTGNGWAGARCSAWHCVGKLYGEIQRWGSRLGCEPIFQAQRTSANENTPPPAWYAWSLTTDFVRDAWVLDLKNSGKGLLYVNGVLLGRFWDVVATRPRNGFLDGSPIEQAEATDEPTQRYYHVPPWVVDESSVKHGDGIELHIVLFVEHGRAPKAPPALLEAVPPME